LKSNSGQSTLKINDCQHDFFLFIKKTKVNPIFAT
jgi:hypothetical protein